MVPDPEVMSITRAPILVQHSKCLINTSKGFWYLFKTFGYPNFFVSLKCPSNIDVEYLKQKNMFVSLEKYINKSSV